MSLGKRIRETRLKNAITLRKLAKMVEVSPSFISQVEQDKAHPSIDSLQKISSLLHVSSSYLLGEEDNQDVIVIRHKKGKPKLIQGVELKSLISTNVRKNILDPYLMTIQSGTISEKVTEQTRQGEEFLLLLSGSLEVSLGDKNYTLKQGDNIYFDSSVAHQFKNMSSAPAQVLWVSASL